MVLRMQTDDNELKKILEEIHKEEKEQGLMGPPMEKIMLLAPEDAPMYKLLATLRNQSVDNIKLKVEHRWLEDELWPEPMIAGIHEPPSKRICPLFVLCPYDSCNFYAPFMTEAKLIICRNWDEGYRKHGKRMDPKAIKNGFEKYVGGDKDALCLIEVDHEKEEEVSRD